MGFNPGGGGGSSSSLSGSTDVALSTPTNAQVLSYDTGVAKWKNSVAVSSVNTRSGAVTLTKGDVGLANVDNTADAAKPISSATQTALNAKIDASAAQVVVRYNTATSSWPARPAGALWGVLFLSTNDQNAAAPSDANLAAGDRWLRHPNAS